MRIGGRGGCSMKVGRSHRANGLCTNCICVAGRRSAQIASDNHWPTTRSIPDLSDEQTPLAVDDVPGVGPAQLCCAQRVHDAACICLRVDIGHPPAVTSVECPHGYTCGFRPAPARLRRRGLRRNLLPSRHVLLCRICRGDGNRWSRIPLEDAANSPGDVLPGPVKCSRVVYHRPYPRQFLGIRNLRRFLQQSQSRYRAAHHHTPEVSELIPVSPSLRRSSGVKAVPRLRLGVVSATGVCESALFMMLFLIAVHPVS